MRFSLLLHFSSRIGPMCCVWISLFGVAFLGACGDPQAATRALELARQEAKSEDAPRDADSDDISADPRPKPPRTDDKDRAPRRPKLIPWKGGVVFPDRQEWYDFYGEIGRRVTARQFLFLERQIEGLRAESSYLSSGFPAVYAYYEAINEVLSASSEGKEDENLAFFEAWRSAQPKSPTPRVGLARLYTARAWNELRKMSRVNGNSEAKYEKYLQLAHLELDAVREQGQIDIYGYYVWLEVARGLRYEEWRAQDFLREVINRDEGFIPAYHSFVLRLTPAWGGSSEKVLEICAELADELGGARGDYLYARLAWEMLKHEGQTRYFHDYPFDAERIERGIRHGLDQFPQSRSLTSRFMELASVHDKGRWRTLILEHTADWSDVDLGSYQRRSIWERERANPEKTLSRAIERADAPYMVLLLRAGASYSKKDSEDRTPLDQAIDYDDRHLMALLEQIDAPASASRRASTKAEAKPPEMTLADAAKKGDLQSVARLLADGANVEGGSGERTPLHHAVNSQREDVVKALLDAGADPNALSEGQYLPLVAAASHGRVSILKLLIDAGADPELADANGWRVMIAAAHGESIEALRYFLEQGVSVDQRGAEKRQKSTALSYAVEEGYLELVRLLLDAGATTELFDNAMPALHFAAQENHPEIIRLLLDRGTDPNLTWSQYHLTPTHSAAANDAAEAIEALAQHPDINLDQLSKGGYSETPLHLCAYEGKARAAEALLQWGANPEIRNGVGLTPLEGAHHRGKMNVVEVLEQGIEPLIQLPVEEYIPPG